MNSVDALRFLMIISIDFANAQTPYQSVRSQGKCNTEGPAAYLQDQTKDKGYKNLPFKLKLITNSPAYANYLRPNLDDNLTSNYLGHISPLLLVSKFLSSKGNLFIEPKGKQGILVDGVIGGRRKDYFQDALDLYHDGDRKLKQTIDYKARQQSLTGAVNDSRRVISPPRLIKPSFANKRTTTLRPMHNQIPRPTIM